MVRAKGTGTRMVFRKELELGLDSHCPVYCAS
jgi:hypothetical protein